MTSIRFLAAVLIVMTLPFVISSCGTASESSGIIGKIWNADIACTPVAVVVKLEGKISTSWIEDIRKAASTRSCKAIVLHIESGGGTVTDTKLLAHKIQKVKEEYDIEIYTYSERILASGAYWLAATTDHITISPAAITGSIGVYLQRIDMTKLDSMWGIQWHYIQSGKCKTYGNPHKKLTKEEEKFWQNYIIRLYNEFLQTIWDNRKAELHTAYSGIIQIPEPLIDSTKVKQYLMQISDGRIYDAELAHVLGLVDKVFYLDEYVEYLKSRKFKVVDLDGLKFKP